MKCRALVFSFALSLSPAAMAGLSPAEALAQDACTVQDVDEALNQLSCFADGVYLAPQGIADVVTELCYDEYSEEACRACFRGARRKLFPGLKGLGRLGLISRDFAFALRDDLDFAEDETCYLADEWPWDSGNNAPDNVSREKQKGRGRKGEDGARGRTSASAPRSSIRGRGTASRQLVEDLCPCNSPRWQQEGGQAAFLSCADTVTDILARHGKIDSRRAKDLRSQLQRSECGR